MSYFGKAPTTPLLPPDKTGLGSPTEPGTANIQDSPTIERLPSEEVGRPPDIKD